MGEIITSSHSKVGVNLVDSIGCELGFLFNYDSNVEDLKKEVEKLGDLRGGVERSIDAARRNGEEIEPDDEKWLKCVNGITKESEEFLCAEEEAEKGCFNGLCPNLKSRYELSKKARKITEEIVKLQGDGRFDRVSYGAFEPRMSILKEIVEELRNPNVSLIGVHGIGGVGKTMLLKEVGRKVKEDKLFDEVVMAVVLQTQNIRIHEEIA